MTDDIRTRVRELIDALGNDEQRIYASLRAMGVTGQRGEPCACPLFYYLRDAGIPVERVAAGYVVIHGMDEVIFLSDAARDFIEGFDVDNAYPALVEPDEVNQ